MIQSNYFYADGLVLRKNSKSYEETLKAAICRTDDYISDYKYLFRNETLKWEKFYTGLKIQIRHFLLVKDSKKT
jgi:hypothetical protein